MSKLCNLESLAETKNVWYLKIRKILPIKFSLKTGTPIKCGEIRSVTKKIYKKSGVLQYISTSKLETHPRIYQHWWKYDPLPEGDQILSNEALVLALQLTVVRLCVIYCSTT